MKLTELIRRGDLKKALDILEEKSNGFDADFSREILIQQSRLREYVTKKRLRIEADNTLDIERNRLSVSIYDLILEFESQYGEIEISDNIVADIEAQELDENNNEPNEDIKKAKRRKFLLYFNRISFILLIIIYSFFGWGLYSLYKLWPRNFHFLNNSESVHTKNITEPIKHISQVGFDKSDRKLHIVIDILDKKFTWRKNEITIGEYIYEGRVVDLREYFKDQLYLEKMNESVEIICLGNASFEESLIVPVERRKSNEETRASIRAHNLKEIIKSLLKNREIPIYVLNLGKYKLNDPSSSNMQRSIVIIRILEKEEGVNVNQALHNALITSIEMPFKITDYTLIKNDSVELDIK